MNTHLEAITYWSDGLKVRGYMAQARDSAGPVPCVIFNRGGHGDLGALNDSSAVMFLSRIAHHGYVVVASQYRGAVGSEGQDEFGGDDVNDVLNLFPLLDAEPQADASRIGMWAWSRGTLNTSHVLARSDRVSAAIFWSGLYDLQSAFDERPEAAEVVSKLIPQWSTQREQAIHHRSPVRWADTLCKSTPILLVHGSADPRSDVTSQGLAMASALLACQHPTRILVLEGAGHGMEPYNQEADRQLLEWLERYVKQGGVKGTLDLE